MADRADITPELCRQLLRYEPETGKLYWRDRPDNVQFTAKHGGKEAFTGNGFGYKTGRLCYTLLRAHRVIWAIVHGKWPDNDIDHIDGDRANNRLLNLRLVSRRENCRNAALPTDNKSGRIGVHWSAAKRKWAAAIGVNGRTIPLGRFASFEDAVAARSEAEIRFGFHKNHGRHALRPRQTQPIATGSRSTD